MKSKENCPHISGIQEVAPHGEKCEECGSESSLRACIACGHVGCCESQQAHNTKHAREAHHPIIRSLPLSEKSFTWCYECKDYLS
jgi:uncharacterized UBP type Zn finger protein